MAAFIGPLLHLALGASLRCDFGTSIIYNQPVGDMLLVWGLETLKIQIPAILIALLLATGAGGRSRRRGSTAGSISASSSSAMLGHSLPGFFVGILLILVFSYWLGVLPSYGAYSTPQHAAGTARSPTGSGTWCCRWRCWPSSTPRRSPC